MYALDANGSCEVSVSRKFPSAIVLFGWQKVLKVLRGACESAAIMSSSAESSERVAATMNEICPSLGVKNKLRHSVVPCGKVIAAQYVQCSKLMNVEFL